MSILSIKAALEMAVDSMPGLIPAADIVSSSNGMFVTSAPHGLKSGLLVGVSGHSDPSANGEFYVNVTTANSFTLQHLATKSPVASTATGVGGVIIAKLTAWEGVTFKPNAGVPAQRVNFVWATPENPSYGSAVTRESGFMQITLYYPNGYGTRDVLTRAQLIKSTFPRGASFTSEDGVVVHIDKTPNIMPYMPIDENFVLPVRVPFWADVIN